MQLLNEIRFYFFQLKKNFENKRALGLSFMLQVAGMFLNNVSFFIIWMMFMNTIGTVNGWGVKETFGMLSVSMLGFGIAYTFFGSIGTLITRVPTGVFDSFLTKPKSLYLRIINHDFAVSALGDLIQGFLGVIIFVFWADSTIETFMIVLLMVIPAVMIQISFTMTFDCIAFWLPHGAPLSNALRDLILLPSTQPISLLRGTMRYIYMFAIPALVLAGLPIEAFTHIDWKMVALPYAIAFAWFGISYWTLHISLKRYESGNMIG